MMKKVVSVLMLVGLFAVSVFAQDAMTIFKSAFDKCETLKQKGISYKIVTTTGKKKKKAFSATIYMKGDKIRMDSDQGNVLIDGETMYAYSPKDKTAMKMKLDKEKMQQNVADLANTTADNLIYVGKGSMNGYDCQVLKEQDGKKVAEYYLTDAYGFPTYVKDGTKSESNITEFKIGSIKDSIFTLPSDVNVVDMAQLSSLGGNSTDSLKSKISQSVKNKTKETADDTVVGGAKDGAKEIVNEQKSKVREAAKEETKKKLKSMFGI